MSGAEAASPRDLDIDPTTKIDDAEEPAAALEIELDEGAAEPGPLARGAAVIKSFWKHAPLGPGVYRMLGEDGEVRRTRSGARANPATLNHQAGNEAATAAAVPGPR